MDRPGARIRRRVEVRAAGAALVVVLALLGAPAALAAPSPSPSLDTLLASPTSGSYVRTSSVFTPIQGNFDAVDYLGVLDPRKPSETYATLKADGFVQGYGRTWFDRTANRFLTELVVAFAGGAGANRWLPEARALSQASPDFKSDFAVSGIEAAYGVHVGSTTSPAYTEDEIGFVKGNNYFFIDLYSGKSDLADSATKQAKQQFDSAPAQTIPPSQWPENASNNSNRSTTAFSIPPVGTAIIAIAGVLVLLAAVALAVLLISRGRRGPSQGAGAAADPQMSADGNYWWDGLAWRNASEAAPPAAHRSPDGRYWWDGTKWRQMPSAPEPAPAAAASEPPPPAQETSGR